MKQVRPVSGENLNEFAEAMNEAYCELSRFNIERVKEVSEFSALIYYEIPDELFVADPEVDLGPQPDYDIEFPDAPTGGDTVTIRLKVGRSDGRHCCECDNYNWAKGCPYRDGVVRLMAPACKMFNVIIEGRF